ncbi:prolipoprotein diacylglyceryl transferase [Inquilinus sp.]|jgi:phosphatidylglycerol:prolipoprotein diacylglycerol transferase|uniref:prolipoprotein diacylglyceryl transferase n=1 Tax=Inquilinus sp. TaxID=1932117 RepID=UPI003784A8C8
MGWFDPVALQIGPIAIRWYALAYIAGFVLGWRYALWLTRRTALPPDRLALDDFLTWAVVGTILGGRLGYVLFYNFDEYLQTPGTILEIWKGGMSFHGGMLGVTAAIILFAWRRGFSPLLLGDVVAAAAPIGLFFGRIANFINGELWGRPTDLPWAFVFPSGGPLPRHPSQLYEAGLEGLLLFLVLLPLAASARIRSKPGIVLGTFIAWYGVSRFVVEFVREPDAQLGYLMGTDWFTRGQELSLPMIVIGIAVVIWAARRPALAAPAATPASSAAA